MAKAKKKIDVDASLEVNLAKGFDVKDEVESQPPQNEEGSTYTDVYSDSLKTLQKFMDSNEQDYQSVDVYDEAVANELLELIRLQEIRADRVRRNVPFLFIINWRIKRACKRIAFLK